MIESRNKRWFARCLGCLSIMAIESEGRPPARMRCSACTAQIEIMGQVRYQRIVNIEAHTPCDARCTMASGPSCDCQCGGKNHGSKITVAVAVDVGGIPRVTPPNPEKAVRTYQEWLRARTATEARIVKHFPALRLPAGFETGPALEAEIVRGNRYLDRVALAGRMKTHHGRLKALESIHAKLTEAAR